MWRGGDIFALDLGRLTGVAVGRPGSRPHSFTWELARRGEGREVAGGNLIASLDRAWTASKPGLVIKEAPLSLQGFKTLGMSEAVIRMTYGLHLIVEAMCRRHGVPCIERYDSTIRRHFTGKGRFGTREETKRAVVMRCRQLGYVPADGVDEDRCDALSAWDFACVHIARRPPAALVLFAPSGQGRRRRAA